ncbi:MAG: hypothetical protein CBC48_02360 [bacterium TMED88]|nr:MAG: hypothetical protein CBC48_02360 [bacterium TMED88]
MGNRWPSKDAQRTLRAVFREYAVDLGSWFVRGYFGVQRQAGFMLNVFAPEAVHREMVRELSRERLST